MNFSEILTDNATIVPTLHNSSSVPGHWSNIGISLCCIRIFFGLLAVSGNSLIIHCVIKFRTLRSTTHYAKVNLAASDLAAAINLICFTILHILFCCNLLSGPALKHAMDIQLIIMMSSVFANSCSIFLIALERFVCIKFALRYYTIITERKIKVVLAVTWTLVLLVPLWLLTPIDRQKKLMVFIIFVNMPVACAIIAYVHISFAAFKKNREIVPQPQVIDGATAEDRYNHRVQWKITKFLALVLGICIVSRIMFTVQCIMTVQGNPANTYFWQFTSDRYRIVGSIVWGFNISVNPFLYAWKSKPFRICMRKQLGLRNNEVIQFNG